jgi:N-acetylmuramoyl-L-alanine amidase
MPWQGNLKFMMLKKYLILVIGFGILVLGLSGCATVATREALSTYNINGTDYLSLAALCNLRNIEWEYDTFTKTATLTKESHKINLRVGDTLVLVDGTAQHLKHPVDIYQGAIVVPYRFKEQVIDLLFKESYPQRKFTCSLLKIKRIVIDAGHGGNDPGAIGRAGLREKDVNLDIAKRLGRILSSNGIDVVMTRSIDRFVPLHTRVDKSNNSGADLFISIHANANRVRSLSGFEVYYVAPSVNDASRALATAKTFRLNLASACFASQALDLKATLWDMIYTYSRGQSIDLSRAVCRAISRDLGVKILGVKGARYEVLKGVFTPAVLIEVGFLSNSNEERMLKNNYYRQRVAESIAQGIEDYSGNAILMEATKR